jgi:hypothetical protein
MNNNVNGVNSVNNTDFITNINSLNSVRNKTFNFILSDFTRYRITVNERFRVYKYDPNNKASRSTIKDALLEIKEYVECQGNVEKSRENVKRMSIEISGIIITDVEEKRKCVDSLWIIYMLKTMAPRKNTVSIAKVLDENDRLKKEIENNRTLINGLHDNVVTQSVLAKQKKALTAAEVLELTAKDLDVNLNNAVSSVIKGGSDAELNEMLEQKKRAFLEERKAEQIALEIIANNEKRKSKNESFLFKDKDEEDFNEALNASIVKKDSLITPISVTDIDNSNKRINEPEWIKDARIAAEKASREILEERRRNKEEENKNNNNDNNK